MFPKNQIIINSQLKNVYSKSHIGALTIYGVAIIDVLLHHYTMRKLIYVSSPYSAISDKEALMRCIARESGEYMIANPGEYAVTGLVGHYSVVEVPGLGTDYVFWQDFCEMLISKSDKVLVLMIPGWQESTGVRGEIEYATALGLPIEYKEVKWQTDL